MDQIWLASPSPALRLWTAHSGATWRLNPAAMAWGRGLNLNEASWGGITAALSEALTGSSHREGRLSEPGLRWRSLPMSTGWLVWLIPESEPVDDALGKSNADPVRAQQAISEQWAKALWLAEVSVWRIDLQRREVHLNDAGRVLANSVDDGAPMSLETMLGLPHPDDVPALARAARAALRGRAVVDVEARFPTASGTSFRHLLTRRVAERDADGKVVGLFGVALDQTERIAERERAERLARRIDMVADAAGAGIWLLDLQTGAAEWNRQMFVLHGLPEDAAAPGFDAYADEIVHRDDRDAFRRARRDALDAEAPRFDTEFRILRPDGSLRWIEYRSRCDRRDGRDVIVGIALDATDRIAQRTAAERTLREKGALERASMARSEFLARMSHELRTPLNAVLGFAQLIEHDGTSVPAAVQLDRVVHIREAGEQLLRLIGDVLEHLKRETPPDEEGPSTVPAGLDGDPGAGAAAHRSLSVLYIEDNPVNVILVEELVAMRPNTSLRCAVTGLAGVALASSAAPHVVLVDMQLPDIDGFEVLRRLRTNRALDRSAVIALSANGMGEDIALALAAGFDDYWTKPIDFRHFLNGLDTLARAR